MLQKHKEEKLWDTQADKLKLKKGEVEEVEKVSASARARKPVTPAPSDDEEDVNHSDDELDSEDVVITPVQKDTQKEEKQPEPKPLTLKAKKEVIASTRKYKTKCHVSQADLVYPFDEDLKHQTGVDKALVGYRQKLPGYKGAYECLWKDCVYAAQMRGVVCSHLAVFTWARHSDALSAQRRHCTRPDTGQITWNVIIPLNFGTSRLNCQMDL